MSGNKSRQRKYALLLVFALSMSLILGPGLSLNSYAESSKFDGTQSGWAVSELEEVFANGLSYPQIENNYSRFINREEFAVIAVKLFEKLGGTVPTVGANPFIDTSNPEILKAYAIGIVNGRTDTTFAPGDNITRQEITLMIYRALRIFNPDMDVSLGTSFPFNDASSIASWALEAMKFAYKNGIMAGTGDGKIEPLANTTREQAMILLKRTFLKYEPDSILVEPPLPEEPEEPEVPEVSEEPEGTSESIEISVNPGLLDKSINKTLLGTIINTPALDALRDYFVAQNRGTVGFPLKTSDSSLKGLQYLGRGYNGVTGYYADVKSVSEYYILDINKLLADGRIQKIDANYSISEFASGSDLETYYRSLSEAHNLDQGSLLFRGSSQIKENTMEGSEVSNKRASIIFEAPQYGVYISDLGFNLADYLNPSFLIELKNADPVQLFKKYGTHVLRSIRMGGRLEYSTYASSRYTLGMSDFEKDTKASFNALFASAGLSVSTSSSSVSETFKNEASSRIYAYPAYGSFEMNPSEFSNWFNYSLSNPSISGFGNDPLVPIYTLAPTEARRNQLKAAYETYLNDRRGW